jgi:hypothetical protein
MVEIHDDNRRTFFAKAARCGPADLSATAYNERDSSSKLMPHAPLPKPALRFKLYFEKFKRTFL